MYPKRCARATFETFFCTRVQKKIPGTKKRITRSWVWALLRPDPAVTDDEDLIQELGLCRRPLFGLLSFRIPQGNPMVGNAFAHMLGFSEKNLAGEVSN